MTFTTYLQTIHMQLHPAILDDDLPDAFDNWLSNMPQDVMIDLADLYAKELLTNNKQ